MFKKNVFSLFALLLFSNMSLAMENNASTADEALINAIFDHNWKAIPQILEEGAHPFAEIPLFGSTAMHYAIFLEVPNETLILMLIKIEALKADINTKNSMQMTVLDVAQNISKANKEYQSRIDLLKQAVQLKESRS